MHRKRTILIALAFFILAGALLAYPWVSSLLSDKYHSDVETAYYEQVDQEDKSIKAAALQEAMDYNTLLADGTSSAAVNTAYAELLNLADNGIMGYVWIPSLDIDLPICHGTDAKTLEYAVGHVKGSSLPVGGKSTHSILSAHSGMSISRLFSDIDQLREGDTFYIRSIDEILAYEVDQIAVVEPTDTSLLGIEKGKDYVTLVTCTPFGVNTHRLLVRGHRTELPAAEAVTAKTSPAQPLASTWTQHYLMGLGIGGGLLILIAIIYLITKRRRT